MTMADRKLITQYKDASRNYVGDELRYHWFDLENGREVEGLPKDEHLQILKDHQAYGATYTCQDIRLGFSRDGFYFSFWHEEDGANVDLTFPVSDPQVLLRWLNNAQSWVKEMIEQEEKDDS